MFSSIVEACKGILGKRTTSKEQRQKQSYQPILVQQLQCAFEARNLASRVDANYDTRFAEQYLTAQFARLAELTRSCFHQPHLLERRKALVNVYKDHILDYVRDHPQFKEANLPFYTILKDEQMALWQQMQTSWSPAS